MYSTALELHYYFPVYFIPVILSQKLFTFIFNTVANLVTMAFMAPITTTTDGWHQLTESDTSLDHEGARIHAKVDGRFVSVVRGRGERLYCIDAVCYHMGGPLTVGDIEEVNGEICIKCPWHHYDVTLETGAKLYQAMDFDKSTKKLVPAGWMASEKRQRVHNVEFRGDVGAVWVQLSSNDKSATRHQDADTLDYVSDKWAYNAGAAGNVCRPGMNKGGDGRTVEKMRLSGDGRHPNRGRLGGSGIGSGIGSGSGSGSRSSRGRGSRGRFGGSVGRRIGYKPSGSVLADARTRAKQQKVEISGIRGGISSKRGRGSDSDSGGGGGSGVGRAMVGGSGKQSELDRQQQTQLHSSFRSTTVMEEEDEEEEEEEAEAEERNSSSSSSMRPDQWNLFTLVEQKRLSVNIYLYKFALATSRASLGWTDIERHVRVRAKLPDGTTIMREYTPISNPSSHNGMFDLAVKLYKEGAMSQVFANLHVGEALEMSGPFGDVTLIENEEEKVEIVSPSHFGHDAARPVRRITMLAAGSGLTPMIQILNVMISSFSSNACPPMDIVIANKTYKDICFRLHLERVSKRWSNRFDVLHVLSQESTINKESSENVVGDVMLGRINIDCLQSLCNKSNQDSGEKTQTSSSNHAGHYWLVCGPRTFELEMKATLVQGLHISDENVLNF